MNKRRSQSEWQRLIDEQAASGLTQKAYCEQAGIALATFGYWKRKLQSDRLSSSVSGDPAGEQQVSLEDWVELSAPVPQAGSGWRIELDLGNGVCLRLRQG